MIFNTLSDCLHDRTGSYVIPLLWYAGESTDKLRREIQAVQESGLREFIFENRGDIRFCQEPWMQVLETAILEAEKRGMRVWLMDDSHVSTGSCNDSLGRPENAEFRAQNLRVVSVDAAGAVAGDAVMLPNRTEKEEILTVAAYRRDEKTGHSCGEPVDLTGRMQDGLCLLDLPAGIWRIYFIMKTDPARTGLFARYLTMMSPASCHHLIEEVHEKIYARFAKYFGNVFAGFFSDEPSFGNCNGQYSGGVYNTRTGKLDEIWPWWDDMAEKLAERRGCDARRLMLELPAMWDQVDGLSARIRLDYMNEITCRWRDNFSRQLGRWCEDHHVEYIGHYLEDMKAHMRGGWGCGHYFRTMQGQHMAGIDLVIAQMVPGIWDFPHSRNNDIGPLGSRFYAYTLPKLAPSLAHLSPWMKNRSICEVFGAMGWTEGLPVMRTVVNLMLAGGVNHYIPHAFSMALPKILQDGEDEYANSAKAFLPPGYIPGVLPPSFYCGGFNPQFGIFGQLMHYLQRLCHLLADGDSLADTGIFYNAEGDWFHQGACSDLDDVTARVSRSGLDFDLLPSDTLLQEASLKDGLLRIGSRSYARLIVPGSEVFPEALLRKFSSWAEQGLPVFFAEYLPERTENPDLPVANLLKSFKLLSLDELAETVSRVKRPGLLQVIRRFPDLKNYAQRTADGIQVDLFYNAGWHGDELVLAVSGPVMVYDAWNNRVFRAEPENGAVRLHLDAQQLLTVVSGAEIPENLPLYGLPADERLTPLDLEYRISARKAGEKREENFKVLLEKSPAVNLIRLEGMTRFCGEFLYESEFSWNGGEPAQLVIPNCGDCAELWLNGQFCGAQLGPVCRFDIAGLLCKGRNSLKIRTCDSPCYLDRAVRGEEVSWGAALRLRKHGFTGSLLIG